MKKKDWIKQVADSVDKSTLKKRGALAAFTVSLLPIPGVQQAGAIATRILDAKITEERFSAIEAQIAALTGEVTAISDTADEALRIAELARENQQLGAMFENLAKVLEDYLRDQSTEFLMETRDYSYQELINSHVSADIAAFISEGHSENLIRDSEVRATKTHLSATGHSVN